MDIGTSLLAVLGIRFPSQMDRKKAFTLTPGFSYLPSQQTLFP